MKLFTPPQKSLATWSTLVALFLIGTHRVALYAEDALSQLDRIERIEAASFDRLPAKSPIPRDANMKLSGNIYSPDGESVEAIVVKFEVRTSGSGPRNSSSHNSEPKNAYRANFPLWSTWFQQPLAVLNSVDLLALAPGFSPSQEINIPGEPGERRIDLHLKPAIAASLRVVDSEGNPVPNARLRYDYLFSNSVSKMSPSPIRSPEKLTTDEQGLLRWAAPEDFPIRFDVSAEGYLNLYSHPARFTKADTSVVLTLSPGHPFKGRVIDAETGEGIPDADIQYLASVPSDLRSYTSWYSEERITSTNDEGHFITHSLDALGSHWLVARAQGYLATFAGEHDGREADTFGQRFMVSVKDSNPILFRMIPQRPVRIEITPPEGISPKTVKIDIASKLHVGLKDSSFNPWTASLKAESREVSEDGKSVIIETTPVAAAPILVKLRSPGRPSRLIRGWDYDKTLEVDFRQAPAIGRDETLVHVTFGLPPEAPLPKGEIVIHWKKGERHYDVKSFSIENGEVRAYVARLPGTQVTIFAGGLIGYYFPPHTFRPLENEPVEILIRKLFPAGAVRLEIDGRKKGSRTSVHVEFANPDGWQAVLADYPVDPGVTISPEYVTARLKGARRWLRSVRPLDYPFRLKEDDDEVFITPVPFDEPMMFRVNQGLTHIISTQILTANEALLELELELPEGIWFTGILLDQNGAPLADRHITLLQSFPKAGVKFTSGQSFKSSSDQTGNFVFEGLNPDAPARYSLELKTERGSRVLATDLDINESFKIYRTTVSP